jgi:radical SAM protein with 4Fe4S-binding SPASM domain
MAGFKKPLARGLQEARVNPDQVLGMELGPRFMAYRQKFRAAESGRRLEYPLHLDVDITTSCQLSCPMCPAGLPAADNPFPGFGEFMDEEMFLEAMREAEGIGIPSIRLGLTGEPLMAPDADLWVSEAARRGFVDLALITNGQLLDRETSERLIKAGLTRLMVSVDAATEETYSIVRPGGDFERLVGNIESFLRARSELKSRLPLLRASFVVMDVNRSEIGAFREKFSPLADYLAFQDYLNVVGRDSLATKGASSPGTGPAALPGEGEFFCPDPLTRLAIHANGGLFPCCSDFGRLEPIGNISRDSLREAWNSERSLALARPKGRQCLPCRECLKASGVSLGKGLGALGQPSEGARSLATAPPAAIGRDMKGRSPCAKQGLGQPAQAPISNLGESFPGPRPRPLLEALARQK